MITHNPPTLSDGVRLGDLLSRRSPQLLLISESQKLCKYFFLDVLASQDLSQVRDYGVHATTSSYRHPSSKVNIRNTFLLPCCTPHISPLIKRSFFSLHLAFTHDGWLNTRNQSRS